MRQHSKVEELVSRIDQLPTFHHRGYSFRISTDGSLVISDRNKREFQRVDIPRELVPHLGKLIAQNYTAEGNK